MAVPLQVTRRHQAVARGVPYLKRRCQAGVRGVPASHLNIWSFMSQLILFTGGARSGKGRRAEQYAATRTRADIVYVATAEAGDDEMRRRIDRHRADRPAAWRTIEAPAGVGARLRD